MNRPKNRRVVRSRLQTLLEAHLPLIGDEDGGHDQAGTNVELETLRSTEK
jgi:hypothetical protein